MEETLDEEPWIARRGKPSPRRLPRRHHEDPHYLVYKDGVEAPQRSKSLRYSEVHVAILETHGPFGRERMENRVGCWL